jgi:hypothetical protein
MSFLGQAAFWASLAALLDAIGISASGLAEHSLVIAAIVAAIIGIVETLISAGHKLHYEGPGQPPAP